MVVGASTFRRRSMAYGVSVPELDRRSMMLVSGLGLLIAAVPLPSARRFRHRTPTHRRRRLPLPGRIRWTGGFGPEPGNWTVQNWQDDVWPPIASQYRDDRQNVFLDGNSNLVIRATQDNGDYFSGKVRGNWRFPRPHLGSAGQARLPDIGSLAGVLGSQ